MAQRWFDLQAEAIVLRARGQPWRAVGPFFRLAGQLFDGGRGRCARVGAEPATSALPGRDLAPRPTDSPGGRPAANAPSRKIASACVLAWALAAASAPRCEERPHVAGAVDPEVTQTNIHETICVKGWTKTVRPPVQESTRIKRELMRESGLREARAFELDHLIPLELGGAPRDARNLWLQPRWGQWSADRKDELENVLHRLVCRRKDPLPLDQAQQAIAHDWISAYRRFVQH
jgi:hypothetical protein